jgi:transcriptional regulator with XRE-family HTH domain
MQGVSDISYPAGYPLCMRTGRPTDQPRTPFGERLVQARQQAGLSQVELAERIGVDRRVIAHWERRSVTLKPEQIVSLAQILGISADELLGATKPRNSGPTGKVRQVFENVSRLPRKQQLKVVEFVEAFVEKKTTS